MLAGGKCVGIESNLEHVALKHALDICVVLSSRRHEFNVEVRAGCTNLEAISHLWILEPLL